MINHQCPPQDKKLRKEENLDLIKKLAAAKVDTTLLRSARSLGVIKPSKREVMSQALSETQAGVNIGNNRVLLYKAQKEVFNDTDDAETSDEEHDVPSFTPSTQSVTPVIGSGLKRSLDVGVDGKPIIKKRKRSNQTISFPQYRPSDETSWNGFSSDAEAEASKPPVLSSVSSKGTETDSKSDVANPPDSNSDDSIHAGDGDKRKARSSAFKAWATGQINEVLRFTPTATANKVEGISIPPFNGTNGHSGTNMVSSVGNMSLGEKERTKSKPRAPEMDPLPPELTVESKILDRKTHSVIVHRPEIIQEARIHLPVVGEEQRIMEAIHNNSTVVIAGDTGSGKTTQVPQFLYEAGYGQTDGPYPGLIGVTQPRRVAATSMTKRVSDELGGEHASRVAHQVRFDSSVGRKTAIKFMTDGILIREIASDFLLTTYSVIIIDEAHERSSNTDILIGLLTRIVDLRESMSKGDRKVEPLKFIIMSATLRIQDFLANKALFKSGPPPLVQVEGRQYPVTVHFARRTQADYVEQAFRKICRGHKMLPPGGMLVFLTGQDEITALARRLKDSLGDDERAYDTENGNSSADDELGEFDVPDITPPNETSNVYVLPLYSQLQAKDQLRVFEPPPEKARMIVLATNIAETSLTIPGIRYVFDCGRAKDRKYDEISGIQSFEVGWISKSSASQRAGRAGRIGPGHCYRLYSSAIYERDFSEHADPEILRMPIEGLVLQLKSMELHNVVNFPFPTPPDRQGLAKAEKLLACLGALSNDGRITPLGRRLSYYPLSPRFAKMLDIGNQHGCMAFTILLVAALATPNIFIPEDQVSIPTAFGSQREDHPINEEVLKWKSDYKHAQYLCSKLSRTADALKAFTALQGYLKAASKEQYCNDTFLSSKSVSEASNLIAQLTGIIRNGDPQRLSGGSSQLSTPSKNQIAALQQITAAGFLDQIAILASESPSPPYIGRNPKRAIDTPYLPLFPINKDKRTTDTDFRDVAVYVHPSSILAHLPVKDMPKYIVYSHLQRGMPSHIEGSKRTKTRLHALTTISERTLASLARGTPLLEYGKPLGKIEEGVGPNGKTRTCFVTLNFGAKGLVGWPLPAQKVVQKKDARGEWVIDQVIG